MSIYVLEYEPFQYVTKNADTAMSTSIMFGVCFTPNKNCSITKVKFLGNTPLAGTLRIAKGPYANPSSSGVGTTYSVTTSNNPNCIYTLSTPYGLIANTKYVVCFTTSGLNFRRADSMRSVYPVVCEDITYNYGTYASENTPITDFCWAISGLEITTS